MCVHKGCPYNVLAIIMIEEVEKYMTQVYKLSPVTYIITILSNFISSTLLLGL